MQRGAGSWRLRAALVVLAGTAAAHALQPDARHDLAELVTKLSRDTRWTLASAVPVRFRTHHPQGMVKVGDALFVSSVEIVRRTQRFPEPVGGHDRDTGAGVGHLFKMDLSGNLLAGIKLGEGAIYHPGGIDYDGSHIWVPVAEYRPGSRAIVYRVDPRTLEAVEVFRFADHIGAIVHDTERRTLHGVSWGSRRFYSWPLGRDGRVIDTRTPPAESGRLNPSHYVDYQDCRYAGRSRMLCSGVAEIRGVPGAPPIRLGGVDLIDLRDGRPLHQVPVLLWTPDGLDMTHNPVWIEPHRDGLRAYFMPDDDTSTLYVYEAGVK